MTECAGHATIGIEDDPCALAADGVVAVCAEPWGQAPTADHMAAADDTDGNVFMLIKESSWAATAYLFARCVGREIIVIILGPALQCTCSKRVVDSQHHGFTLFALPPQNP